MPSIKRNIIAGFVGQGWSALMAVAFVPLYVRYVGIEAYGVVGLFSVMQAWLVLLDMGMTPTLNREMARFTAGARSEQSIHDLLRSLELLCLASAALIGFGVWAASDWLARDWLRVDSLPVADVAQALSVTALVIALRFVEGVYRGALLGLQRQVWYNGVNVGLATVRWAGAAAVLAWVSPSVEAFFLWQAACSLLTVCLFALKVHRVLPAAPAPPCFSPRALAAVRSFAAGTVGTTALALLLTQVDKILLSRLVSLQAFGYYTLATSVVGALYMLVGPITASVYPRMVELAGASDEAGLASVYHAAAQIVTALTAPAALLLSFFAQGILFAWSGDTALSENAAPVLSALAAGTLLNCLMNVPYQLQLAHGWTSLALKSNALAVLTLVPALLYIVPSFGAIGAAWVWAFLNAGYVLFSVQVMHRRLIPREMGRWYREDVLRPLLSAMLVLGAAYLLRPNLSHSRLVWAIFLLATLCVGVLAAVVACSGLRPQLTLSLRRH